MMIQETTRQNKVQIVRNPISKRIDGPQSQQFKPQMNYWSSKEDTIFSISS
jgi:hypothetical protein